MRQVPEQRGTSIATAAGELEIIDTSEKRNPVSPSLGQREDPIPRRRTAILNHDSEFAAFACQADG